MDKLTKALRSVWGYDVSGNSGRESVPGMLYNNKGQRSTEYPTGGVFAPTVLLTQAQYDAISSKDPQVLYFIVG